MRITVPGNVLLAGEYAVTEESGLGLAFAVEPRLVLESFPGAGFQIEGILGSDHILWPSDGERARLFQIIVDHMRRSRPEFDERMHGTHIVVDSSTFFSANEQKRGFGSSAATVVGLVFALSMLARSEPKDGVFTGSETVRDECKRIFPECVRIHREFQNGRGSGYDIAASLFGGTGLFRGGQRPQWKAINLPWLQSGTIRWESGPAQVRTTSALQNYEGWKKHSPAAFAEFLLKSNETVSSLAAATDADSAPESLDRARDLGVRLGGQIGIPAASVDYPGWACKSVGAGNEMTVLVSRGTHPVSAPGEPLVITMQGIVVEEEN